MSKRKIVLLAMALCMVAILAVGGTLAYFTDTEQAHNTMVIGNVEINIDEFTYIDGKWDVFKNDEFVLYPMANELGGQIRNKIVYTANTSSSKHDVYIRTIILFEYNEKAAKTDCCLTGLHFKFATNDVTLAADGKEYVGSTNEMLGIMEVDGKKYEVVVFTEKDGNAIPYDRALYSMSAVWMDENVTQEVAKGWGEDSKVDIIVFSQGIQATGLTHEQAMAELGEINSTNLSTWIDAPDAVINDWTTK